jgi:uncharacterized protein (DUF486 family)
MYVSNLHFSLFDPIVVSLLACNIFTRFLLVILQIVQSCALCLIIVQPVCILFVSYPSQFFHYFPFAPGNMVTFVAIRHSQLIVMVDESRTIAIFEHYLCVMFIF